MRKRTLILALIFLMCLTAGCQHALLTKGGYTGQGQQVERQGSAAGAVVQTFEDGSAATTPIPVDKTTVVAPPPAPAGKRVVAVTVIPPQPSKSSYKLTPERRDPDTYTGFRGVSWAAESPNTAAKQIATEKEKHDAKPLPGVTLDDEGVHLSKGGGSTTEEKGTSWTTSIADWWHGLWSGWTMGIFWIVILGVAVLFILPIFVPALAPVMQKLWQGILTVMGWFWDVVERIIKWFESRHKPPAPPTPPPPPVTP